MVYDIHLPGDSATISDVWAHYALPAPAAGVH